MKVIPQLKIMITLIQSQLYTKKKQGQVVLKYLNFYFFIFVWIRIDVGFIYSYMLYNFYICVPGGG